MNESIYHQLREISWRRKLTPEEETRLQGWLAAHPDRQAEWELEQSLTEQLRHLADAPLSSNFTSQVMQTLDAELARQEREGKGGRNWLQWLHKFAPRLAPVSLALVVAITAFVHYRNSDQEQQQRQTKRVESVEHLVGAVPLEILEDFDAISHLPLPPTDEDLLAALQ
jgi:anti-sigma factor RsiW